MCRSCEIKANLYTKNSYHYKLSTCPRQEFEQRLLATRRRRGAGERGRSVGLRSGRFAHAEAAPRGRRSLPGDRGPAVAAGSGPGRAPVAGSEGRRACAPPSLSARSAALSLRGSGGAKPEVGAAKPVFPPAPEAVVERSGCWFVRPPERRRGSLPRGPPFRARPTSYRQIRRRCAGYGGLSTAGFFAWPSRPRLTRRRVAPFQGTAQRASSPLHPTPHSLSRPASSDASVEPHAAATRVTASGDAAGSRATDGITAAA